MRDLLTIVAGLLIAVLTAALVGPSFVDWTAHRDFVEARLTQALGARVTTRGAIDVSLLPVPRLSVDGLVLKTQALSIESQALSVELAVAPLLRGELRFIEASLMQPKIEADLDQLHLREDEALAMQFERLDIKRGSLLLRAGGRDVARLDALDLQGEAASLIGPFKGQGTFARDEKRVSFRFNTSTVEGERLRFKLISDEAATLPRIDLDAAWIFDKSPRVEGQLQLTATQPAPWRLAGPLTLSAMQAQMDTADLRIGGEEGALVLSGQWQWAFAPASVSMQWQARQLDLDRAREKQPSLSALFEMPALTLPLRFSLTTPAIIVGGEALSDLAIDLAREANGAMRVKGSSAGPGGARVAVDGQVETGFAAGFQGQVQASLRDAPRLADWLKPFAPAVADALREIPSRVTELQGEMDVSQAGLSLRRGRLKLDRSSFAGSLAYTRAIGSERARLFADLTSDALDLDTLPDLSRPASILRDADLSLALDARAMRVARVGEGMVDAGRIRLKLVKDGKSARLEQLSLANLGGATVLARGELDERDGALEIDVDAQRLSELASLLQRVAPGPVPQALTARAVALSPMRASVKLLASRENDALRLNTLELDATARGTRWQASLRPQGASAIASGTMRVETRDAPMLLRQLGVEALPVPLNGGGRLQASLRAGRASGFDLSASGSIGGVDLSFDGQVATSRAQGAVTLNTRDAAPLLRSVGYGLPDVTTSLPVDGNAQLDWQGGQLQLTKVSGNLAGQALGGTLNADWSEPRAKLTGELQAQRVHLPQLAALLMGPSLSTKQGELWSDQPFAPGMADLPRMEIKLRAQEMVALDQLALGSASLTFTSAPGLVSFTNLDALMGAARVSGEVSLRRDGANGFLIGKLTTEGVPLPPNFADGSFALEGEFTSSGRSAQSLMSGLAGTARLRLGALRFNALDPSAPARVFAEAEADKLGIGEAAYLSALRRELEKGSFTLSQRDALVTLAGGVARIAAPQLSASLDLRNMTSEARLLFPVQGVSARPQEPTPIVAVVWRGPFNAMKREIEASSFVTVLVAHALEREQARMQALDEDIAERASMARRQRGFEFLRRRQREIEQYLQQNPN